MSTLRGVAVVTGAGGTGAGGLTFTIAPVTPAAVNQMGQNNSIDRDADIKYLKSGVGDSVSAFITDRKTRINWEGVLYGTTVALARAEVNKVLIAPGASVAFVDADLTVPDTAPSGETPAGGNASAQFLLESSKVSRTNDGFLMASIVCVRFDDNDLTLQPA